MAVVERAWSLDNWERWLKFMNEQSRREKIWERANRQRQIKADALAYFDRIRNDERLWK